MPAGVAIEEQTLAIAARIGRTGARTRGTSAGEAARAGKADLSGTAAVSVNGMNAALAEAARVRGALRHDRGAHLRDRGRRSRIAPLRDREHRRERRS